MMVAHPKSGEYNTYTCACAETWTSSDIQYSSVAAFQLYGSFAVQLIFSEGDI